MAVVKERQVNEVELARAWVECRGRVLRTITRRFPTAGSAAVEAAVDQAWMELYEKGNDGEVSSLQGRWEGLAYLRALNGVRARRRHPVSPVPVEDLPEPHTLSEESVTVAAIELARSDARVEEIIRHVGGDSRRWLEAVLDTPTAPPRELAVRLRWAPEKLKSVARRTRPHLLEFLRARSSGVICERRQAVIDAFAATHLTQQNHQAAKGLRNFRMLGSGRYEQVALHIAGCEECERAWRQAQHRLLRPRLVVIPIGVYGKLAAAGESAFAAGRRVLGRLDRLLCDLRMRVGSSAGRATAGGAAGTAGTAGALAGKGAAVCVSVLCATGVGTAALVGLPAGIIASRTAAHHHARIVVHHSGRSGSVSDSAAAATATTNSQAASAHSDTSGARAGKSGQRASAAHTVSRPARPVTPGSLVATSSATTTNETASQPSAQAASPTATANRSEVSTEYVPSAASPSSQSSSSSSSSAAKHRPCVPGSLSC
jgi:hypothetical protein